MEHVFPIRCSILEDSPHASGDHQKREIEKQRVVLVEGPEPKPPTPSPASSTASSSSSGPEPKRPALKRSSDRRHTFAPPDGPGSTPPGNAYVGVGEYGFVPPSAMHHRAAHGLVRGKRARFARCEDEPIHIPGNIQSYGMLAAMEMTGSDPVCYVCRVVSENSASICRYPPPDVLGLDNFLRIISPSQRAFFHSKALAIRSKFLQSGKSSEPEVFSLHFLDATGCDFPIWCAMHFGGGAHNLLICEFETADASGVDNYESDLPPKPIYTQDSNPDDCASSFRSKSEPLSFGTTLQLFHGQGKTMNMLSLVSRLQQQLSSQTSVQALLDVLVGLVQEVTGYHRIMVYRFDDDYNGEVVAELCDPRASLDIFKGLHFPAEDIPKQARALYGINRVRVLFDREQPPSRLVSRPAEYLKSPLDLTHSYLRGVSPVHLKYLGNMQVGASMSVALNYQNKLWGLLCCHSYGPKRLPFPIRELCYWIGQCASTCLEKLLHEARLDARRIADTMDNVFNGHAWISTSSAGLLHIFNADFGFLVIQGEARTIGKLSSYTEAVTLLKYVYFRNFEEIFSAVNITKELPDLVYEPGFKHIAGLLCIPLSHNVGDFVVLFRASQDRDVHWAGNPREAKQGGDASLEPRNSFKKWTERVRGICQDWTEEQYEAAALTRLVYGNFIRVWRDKEAAIHESRLKRLMIVNLSHELRTPLNAIINYLELAIENEPSDNTLHYLTNSQTASKSLIGIVDELLHLTGCVKAPPSYLIKVPFNLPRVLRKSHEVLRQHAVRKGLTFEIMQDIDLPVFVLGDIQRLQETFSNLLTNSIQYTEKGGIVVYIGLVTKSEERCIIRISVQDTGRGMSGRELDNIFKEFEQVSDDRGTPEANIDDEMRIRPVSSPSQRESHLGLGLAVLATFVKHTGGQVRGKSEPGVGTTFELDIPLLLADEDDARAIRKSSSTPSSMSTAAQVTPNASTEIPKRPTLARFPTTPVVKPHVADPEAPTDVSTAVVPAPRMTTWKDNDKDTFKNTRRRPTALRRDSMSAKDKFTVIVADDNSVNCSILMRRLNKMGHEVKLCRDGQQCFETFQKDRDGCDFVLMDINMPIVDGVQATRMIRALEQLGYEDTPMSTGSALFTPSNMASPGENGFNWQITLPKSPDSNWDRPFRRFSIGTPEEGPRLRTKAFTEPCFPSLSSSESERSERSDNFDETTPEGTYFSPVQQQSSRRSSVLKTYSSVSSLKSSFFTSSPAPPAPPRIPIFAVSANLNQYSQASLEAAGFDGWLPKPIDFARLAVLLKGGTSELHRLMGLYMVESHGAGGWFR